MEAGNPTNIGSWVSETPNLVRSITEAQQGTSGEIHVYLSKGWLEKDPLGKAVRIFEYLKLDKISHRNAVLVYVNLRRRKFAIVSDEGIRRVVSPGFWTQIAHALREDLLSTHPEVAVSTTVRVLGLTLQRYFPIRSSSGCQSLSKNNALANSGATH